MSILEKKMDAQDMILDDITRNNLFGMVMSREWTQYDYQELWFTGNLKEGNNEAVPGEPERWNIYSHEWKRSKNGRMEQSKEMEYESRKASSDVLKPRNIYTVKPVLNGPCIKRNLS